MACSGAFEHAVIPSAISASRAATSLLSRTSILLLDMHFPEFGWRSYGPHFQPRDILLPAPCSRLGLLLSPLRPRPPKTGTHPVSPARGWQPVGGYRGAIRDPGG